MPTVLIPLAEGFEELEAVTLIDILRRAAIDVTVAGLNEGPVTGSRRTVLLPDTTLDAVFHDDFDLMVLPGGLPGATHLDADERIHQMLKRLSAAGHYTGAICAAPLVLANAGLLKGKRATAYPGALSATQREEMLYQEDSVVMDGKVITSKGPGTAMDFALFLVETLTGKAQRDSVEEKLMRPKNPGQRE